jgi:hypothetical protein
MDLKVTPSGQPLISGRLPCHSCSTTGGPAQDVRGAEPLGPVDSWARDAVGAEKHRRTRPQTNCPQALRPCGQRAWPRAYSAISAATPPRSCWIRSKSGRFTKL